MSVPLLSVQGLHHWFGGLHVINGADFSCPPASVTAIIGPNGAGKTTLFNLVAGTFSPTSGSIVFDGKPIQGLPSHRVAALGISRTFQTTRLFPGMSVLENVMIGRHRRARGGFLPDLGGRLFNGREESRMRRACREVLEGLGIAGLAEQEARSLPFGRQRLVELARALASEPKLLLLDEPACGLNPTETEEMARRIAAVRNTGITILIVEHDMSLVMGISDHVVVLSFGSVIAEGTPREVQANERVVSIYLGANARGDPEEMERA
ncbi:MAG TPA: ABC transporter ATP-binding protein [bacterium]|nr:ABC transporter ATP-binding protein [bacterium]